MRQSLLNTFDQLYFIDLHGNSLKKETTPEGNKDENVFDIKQGVCISIFIKRKGLEKGIFHKDFYGLRKEKFLSCLESSINTIDFTAINLQDGIITGNLDATFLYNNVDQSIDSVQFKNLKFEYKR